MTTREEYRQKIQNNGKSSQVTIPAEIVAHLNIQNGDSILYKFDEKGTVSIEKQEVGHHQMSHAEDFSIILQDGIAEYKDALEDLADR